MTGQDCSRELSCCLVVFTGASDSEMELLSCCLVVFTGEGGTYLCFLSSCLKVSTGHVVTRTHCNIY
ncbi:hypothetical protein HA466_0010440 [Hirschfeldia incana]|nr:hypothetical protein HA466_0010440 [Hirschfeldia incana]